MDSEIRSETDSYRVHQDRCSLHRQPPSRGWPGSRRYALILALIAIIAIVALIFLGGQVSQILSTVGNSV